MRFLNMSNPILDKIDEFGEAVTQMRKANDERLEKLEKGSEARAKELEIQTDKWNTKIDEALKHIKALEQEKEKDKTRIELLEALADRPKGTPTEQLEQKHLQTWVKFVRKGMNDANLRRECEDIYRKELEAKDVTIGTASAGGSAVPTILGREIERLILKFSDIVGEVKTVTAGSGDYSELVTLAGANGGWSSETGTRSNSTTPQLRKVTVTHGELYAYPKVSNWSLNDIFFDVENWLMNDTAETMAVSLSTAIYNGNGSSKPTGMTNSAPTSTNDDGSPMRAAAVFEYLATGNSPVTTATSGDNLIDLMYLLRPGYQTNAKFAMNSTMQGVVRKLKDQYGQYLWQTNFQAGQPATLLGKPILTWEDLGNDATANSLPVAYGDFRRAYLLAKIGGMGMIVNEVGTPGYTQFYTFQRYGGIPLNNDSLKFLKLAAS
jgi:HK97 family phage major capsid protein